MTKAIDIYDVPFFLEVISTDRNEKKEFINSVMGEGNQSLDKLNTLIKEYEKNEGIYQFDPFWLNPEKRSRVYEYFENAILKKISKREAKKGGFEKFRNVYGILNANIVFPDNLRRLEMMTEENETKIKFIGGGGSAKFNVIGKNPEGYLIRDNVNFFTGKKYTLSDLECSLRESSIEFRNKI